MLSGEAEAALHCGGAVGTAAEKHVRYAVVEMCDGGLCADRQGAGEVVMRALNVVAIVGGDPALDELDIRAAHADGVRQR